MWISIHSDRNIQECTHHQQKNFTFSTSDQTIAHTSKPVVPLVRVKAANVPLQVRFHGKGLFTQPTLKRILPGVLGANVILYVRGMRRGVGAEATEQNMTVRRRHEPLPDAPHTFHPQLHALRV
jgi:hypothetical protein